MSPGAGKTPPPEGGYYGSGLTMRERLDLELALERDLEAEIVMLRSAMRRVYESIAGEEDPSEMRGALNTLGLASIRLARLVQTQNELSHGGNSALEVIREALQRATQEILPEDFP